MRKLFLMVVLMAPIAVFSQKSGTAVPVSTTVREQATRMGNALLAGDYDTFVSFVQPTLVKAVGGRQKMIATMAQTVQQSREKGVQVVSIAFGEPTPIVKTKSQMQCTITQRLTATYNGQNSVKSSVLIATSTNGKQWYFLDTTNKTRPQILQVLPELSPKVVF